VNNATQCAKGLTALLKKLPPAEPPDLPETSDPVAVLILSFLLVESTTEKAVVAYNRLLENIVDFNDLRVSMPHEVMGYIGSRYPKALERCQRLRATLRNVYMREHDVTMAPLETAGKRDVRKYIESLEGIVPYVSSRVMLLCFDTHAIPVDEQLLEALVAAKAADPGATTAEVSAFLARQVKATEGRELHWRLQAWSDAGPVKSRSTTKTAKKAPAKKAPAKTPAKKTASKTTTIKKKTSTKASASKKSKSKT